MARGGRLDHGVLLEQPAQTVGMAQMARTARPVQRVVMGLRLRLVRRGQLEPLVQREQLVQPEQLEQRVPLVQRVMGSPQDQQVQRV